MKKVIKLWGLLLLVVSIVNIPDVNVDATPLDLDENFRKCLNENYFGQPADAVITISDMNNFPHTQLACTHKEIESIEGAQHLPTTVTYVLVSDNKISDMSPVSHLTELYYLGFDRNEVKGDVSFISDMTKLKWLSGSSNWINDINTGVDWSQFTLMEDVSLGFQKKYEPGCTRCHLEDGVLSYPGIEDISGLSGLTNAPNLKKLNLSANSIVDISALATLDTTVLETLLLEYNNIVDIEPLMNLNTVGWLDLTSNNISDLSPLNSHNLSSLYELTLGWNNIVDITPINNLSSVPSIDKLSFTKNHISDISVVNWNNFPNLEELMFGGNHITDLSPLGNIAGNLDYGTGYYHYTFFSQQSVTLPDKIVYTSTYKISDADLPVITDVDGSVIPYEASSNQLQTFTNGETKILTATWDHDVEIAGGDEVPFNKTVEQKVTYIFPLSIDADDFTIHIDDASDIYDLLSKTLADARAQDIITGLDLFDKITVNGIELDKIKKTDVTGVFDLTFTVDHNGESATKTIKVTVIGEKTPPPVTPEPVLPETGSNHYVSILILSTVVIYIIKKKFIKD